MDSQNPITIDEKTFSIHEREKVKSAQFNSKFGLEEGAFKPQENRSLELSIVERDGTLNNALIPSHSNVLRNVDKFNVLVTSVIGFVVAWVYLVIPSLNYWVDNLVKGEVWSILALSLFVETMELCVADTHDNTYITTYVIGFIAPPLINVIGYFSGVGSTTYMTIFAVSSSTPIVVLIYGLDTLQRGQKESDDNLDEMPEMFDTFDASVIVATSLSGAIIVEGESEEASKSSKAFQRWCDYFHSSPNSSQADNLHAFNPSGSVSFFRLLPRYVFKSWGIKPGSVSEKTRLSLFICGSAFVVLINSYYYFLIFFTAKFRAEVTSFNTTLAFVAVFVVVGTAFRLAFKRLGLAIDSMKKGSASLYFAGEICCLLFYFCFQRVLFETITSWSDFFIFEGMHLVWEWILYPLRGSKLYFNSVSNYFEATSTIRQLLIGTDSLERKDWLRMMAVDFGLRCLAVVVTGVGTILNLLSIQFLPWVKNGLRGPNYEGKIIFILVATLLELVNTVLIDRLFFVPNNVRIMTSLFTCFRNKKFCFVVVGLVACLFISPLAAYNS